MRDPGDEDDWRSPAHVEPDGLSRLIDEMVEDGSMKELSEGAFEAVSVAEAMRSCCRECALEANGEDGS